MVKSTELYDLLGVDPQATSDQIKRAYRKAALRYHPDKCIGLSEEEKSDCQRRFAEIKRAMDVLSDERKRQIYDRFGMEALEKMADGDGDGPFGPGPFPGGFPFPFGPGGFGGPPPEKRVAPIQIPVKFSLKEAYMGKTQTIEFTRKVVCGECDGVGGSDPETCTKCKGRKVVSVVQQVGPGMIAQQQMPCGKCKAQGKIFQNECDKCHGERLVSETVNSEVTIPRGCANRDHQVLDRMGHHPEKSMTQGDVVAIFIEDGDETVDNNGFTRHGINLLLRQPVTLQQALCGGKITVTHLDGHQISVDLGQIIRPGQRYYLNGEGMPSKNGVSRGDLVIEFDIAFPDRMSSNDQRKIGDLLAPYSDKVATPELGDDYYETTLQPFTGELEARDCDGESSSSEGGPQGVQCQQQ